MNEKTLYIGMPVSFLLKLNPNVATLPEAARKKLLNMLPKETARTREAWAVYQSVNARKPKSQGKGFDIEKAANNLKRQSILGKIYLLKRELCLCDQYRAARIFVDLDVLGKELKKIPK
jgi:hypothetical protein